MFFPICTEAAQFRYNDTLKLYRHTRQQVYEFVHFQKIHTAASYLSYVLADC